MFRDLLGLNKLPLPLRPVGGELDACVFENLRTGVHRNLFWNMKVDFEPVTFDGVEWHCSFLTDWLTWPLRTWHELDGMDLGKVQLPEMTEASFYILDEHFPATVGELQLRARKGSSFDATVKALAQIETEQGGWTAPISFSCPVQFTGVIVVIENLEPKPTTPALAASTVEQFMQLDSLKEPRSDDWRYVLEPEE